jgi:hypothetical protein
MAKVGKEPLNYLEGPVYPKFTKGFYHWQNAPQRLPVDTGLVIRSREDDSQRYAHAVLVQKRTWNLHGRHWEPRNQTINEDFRPPLVYQEDVLPLNRIPVHARHARSNPGDPGTFNSSCCNQPWDFEHSIKNPITVERYSRPQINNLISLYQQVEEYERRKKQDMTPALFSGEHSDFKTQVKKKVINNIDPFYVSSHPGFSSDIRTKIDRLEPLTEKREIDLSLESGFDVPFEAEIEKEDRMRTKNDQVGKPNYDKSSITTQLYYDSLPVNKVNKPTANMQPMITSSFRVNNRGEKKNYRTKIRPIKREIRSN